MKNPPSLDVYGSFVITTYSPDGNKIDEGNTNINVRPNQVNVLRDATIKAASMVNGDQTTYTFSVLTENEIESGGQLRITRPAEISWSSG